MKLEQKALYLNIIVNLFVSFIKIAGGIFWNAFTLTTDGIYTISDLVTDVIALVGVKIGRRRANKNHPYGYGRAFCVVTLFMGILSFAVGIIVIILSFQIDYEQPPLAIIFLIMGIVVVKLISARNMKVVGEEKKCELLIVSSVESKMEAYSSFSLIIVIVLGQFIPRIDMIGGIFIALFLIFQSIYMIRQNIRYLIGITYEDEGVKRKIEQIVDKYKVIHSFDITLIHNGANYQLIIKIELDKNVKVSQFLRLQAKIKKELKSKNLGIKFVYFQLI